MVRVPRTSKILPKTVRRCAGLMTALFVAWAANLAAAPQDTREIHKTVELESGGRLYLETFKGSIKLEPWDREQVEIAARIEAGDGVSARYAGESVAAMRVEIRGSGSRVTIRSNHEDIPSERHWLFGRSTVVPYVHYKIKAPANLRLEIDDFKSEMRLAGFAGRFIIETHKGTLKAHDLSGELILNTHKGEMEIDGLKGSIELSTHKGEIYLDVEKLTGRSRLETYKGTIDVKLPEDLAFTVVADLSRRADFRSDFPLQRRGWSDEDGYFEEKINGGGPELFFKSSRGSIRLKND